MSREQYNFFITTIEKVMKEIKEVKKDVIDSVELTLINPPDSSGRYEVFISKNDYERLKGDAKLVITDLNGEEHILYKVFTGEGVPYYCSANMSTIEWGLVEEYSEESLVIRKVTYGTISLATTSDLQYKQDTLVSGQNIKTVNGQDLLGEGDINTDKMITVSGSLDSNYECIVQISNNIYNELINKDYILKFIDSTSGYNLMFRRSLQENVDPVIEATYSCVNVNMSYTAIIQKVIGEDYEITYVIGINGFSLATEDSLQDKQDVLDADAINDGTINKVLGFDNSNNLIKGTVSGGTKLYAHSLYLTSPNVSFTYNITVINTRSTPYETGTNGLTALKNDISKTIQGLPVNNRSSDALLTIYYIFVRFGTLYIQEFKGTSSNTIDNLSNDYVTEL